MIKNKNMLFVILLFLLFLYKNQSVYIMYDTTNDTINDTTKEGFIENMNGYTRPFIRFKNKYINNYMNKVNTMIQKLNPFE